MSAQRPRSVTAPLLMLGPISGGRGYTVVGRSDGTRLSQREENRLTDLSLAIAAWADRAAGGGEQSFTASFELSPDGNILLTRGKFLGQVGLGTVAMASGLVLSPREVEHSHRLLRHVPEPRRDFGNLHGVTVSLPGEAPPLARQYAPGVVRLSKDLANFKLLVEARRPTNRDELLAFILEGIPEGMPFGWCTTGALEANGGFEPAELFDLIVHSPGDGMDPAGFGNCRSAIVEGSELLWTDIPTPPAREVYDALLRSGGDMGLPGLEWRREYSEIGPGTLVDKLVDRLAHLNDEDFLTILHHWAVNSHVIADSELQQPAQDSLVEAFMARLPRNSPRVEAGLLDQYVDRFLSPLATAFPRRAAMEAIGRDVLHLLKGSTIRELTGRGLGDHMAEATQRALRAHPDMGEEQVIGLLSGMTDIMAGEVSPKAPAAGALFEAALDAAVLRLGDPDDPPALVATVVSALDGPIERGGLAVVARIWNRLGRAIFERGLVAADQVRRLNSTFGTALNAKAPRNWEAALGLALQAYGMSSEHNCLSVRKEAGLTAGGQA